MCEYWAIWTTGFVAGASLMLIAVPVAYHFGWLSGYERCKQILK